MKYNLLFSLASVVSADWSDLSDLSIMGGFEDAVGYVNTKETVGYRLPQPSIHLGLYKKAGELSS